MFCNICNKLFDAYYQSFLDYVPNHLILLLNWGKGVVYSCNVFFTEYLDISKYIITKENQKPVQFVLYAVIVHLGPSSMSGHFVAFCRNLLNNFWYLYNDVIVTLCQNNEQFHTEMPYILFYKKN